MDQEEIFIIEFIHQYRYMYDANDVFYESERRHMTYVSLASEFNKKFNKNVTGTFYVHIFAGNE